MLEPGIGSGSIWSKKVQYPNPKPRMERRNSDPCDSMRIKILSIEISRIRIMIGSPDRNTGIYRNTACKK